MCKKQIVYAFELLVNAGTRDTPEVLVTGHINLLMHVPASASYFLRSIRENPLTCSRYTQHGEDFSCTRPNPGATDAWPREWSVEFTIISPIFINYCPIGVHPADALQAWATLPYQCRLVEHAAALEQWIHANKLHRQSTWYYMSHWSGFE